MNGQNIMVGNKDFPKVKKSLEKVMKMWIFLLGWNRICKGEYFIFSLIYVFKCGKAVEWKWTPKDCLQLPWSTSLKVNTSKAENVSWSLTEVRPKCKTEKYGIYSELSCGVGY